MFNNLSVEDKQTIIEHLEDLRKAFIISFSALIIAAFVCFYYSEQILTVITYPVRSLGEDLIVTGVTEAFFVKLMLSLYAGIIISFPIISWALWGFIKPALYPSERKYVYIFFPVSILLFVGGVLFSYFGILSLVLKFFIYIAGANLTTMFKVDQYVSFVTAFTLPFGIVFEMPVVVFVLTKLGFIRYETLAKNRKYALLAIVIIAAALTPGPDPFSQMMMAAPVYLLYEISIIVSKYTTRSKERGADQKGGKASDS